MRHGAFNSFSSDTVKDNTVFWCCFFIKQQVIPEILVGVLMADVQDFFLKAIRVILSDVIIERPDRFSKVIYFWL